MPDKIKSIGILFLLAILTTVLASTGFAANAKYAALPPFLSAAVKPNVVFVMDYSGSMQAPANYGVVFHGYYPVSQVADYGGWGEVSTNYDSTKAYYGYFDADAYYSYNENGKYWEIAADDKGYSNREAGDVDCLSGNLLNFLVMSRIDVALKSLIGGKASCPDAEEYCILAPQGSRRWVTLSDLKADCHIRPESPDTGNYADKDILITIAGHKSQDNLGNWSQQNSAIGTFTDRYARVKINSKDRKGIVQINADTVRFGFIAYADSNNSTAKEGMIKHGVDNENVGNLISALENTIPYSGTHTGEGMREAYYYLKQDANASSDNGSFISSGTSVDPYYQEKPDGTVEPAWCRRNYVVLISDGEWNGSVDPDGIAHNLHTEDLRTTSDFTGDQFADVFTLYTFSDDLNGKQSMKTIAAFGSYDAFDGCTDSTPYGFTQSDDSRTVTFPRTNCDPALDGYSNCCGEWDQDGDGVPDSFFDANDGYQMAEALDEVFREIRQGVSSSTAVTAITSRATTGAVVTQAVFYPEKEFNDEYKAVWTGNVFGEWFLNAYLEGNLVQNIREDTNGNRMLDVEEDRILEYRIDDEHLEINAYDSDADGTRTDDNPDKTYLSIEDVANLFDCGEKLKSRAASDRTIYGIAEDGTMQSFVSTNSTLFDSFLGSDAAEYPSCLLDATGNPLYDQLIGYVRGEHKSGCRSRSTDGSITSNVWKLGDIMSSTPTAVNYGNYRMIFTGSNDGMLHAFRMGYIENKGEKLHPTRICDDNSETCTIDDMGKEEWAFIPKNSMPYLRYMADPAYDHIYTVDMKPYIVDTGKKTILIGGMRLGGACGNGTINPPADTDPVGLSSYFALDISDPLNPKFLWEFTDQNLGFTYSGPAYVQRWDATNAALKTYVVFASGPTDYDGTAAQPLTIYVLDLVSGDVLYKHNDPNFTNAFGGRLYTDGLDLNQDGQTDFIFLGFTNKATKSYSQTSGGIYKIYTGGLDPETQWSFDVFMSNNIGDPVTGPIKVEYCFPHILPHPYLYFGSGRFFTPNDDTEENKNDFNHLYGVPFTCDIDNNNCSTISSITNSSDLTCDDIRALKTNSMAWKIPLNIGAGNFLRERSFTAPTTTKYNIIFFDTIMPSDYTCECGGKSRSWSINCATGLGLDNDLCGDGSYKVHDTGFTYLIQLSGGDIRQADRSDYDTKGSGATGTSPGVTGDEGGAPTFPPGSFDTYWKQW